MIDINLLRNNLDFVKSRLSLRNANLNFDFFTNLENERKTLQAETQSLQAERNSLSKKIGILKSKGEDCSELIHEVNQLAGKLSNNESNLKELLQQIDDFLSSIPNLPDESVPAGKDESENIEIKKWGSPREFSFAIKDHVDLGENLNLLDFNAAVKITGSRFVVLRGQLARLHRSLAQFMLDTHTGEHGYCEIYTPYMANSASLFGTGQLPKFEEDLFKINRNDAEPYYLIPTAEVSVTNLVRDEIIASEKLPLKFVAHSPCFRSEAGAYGRDTRGMIRQHQFDKVELVQIVAADQSAIAHEELTRHAEIILEKLHLPYRRMLLCSGDIGFSAVKTYDLEVWLPGQNTYREISSCSNCQSFQARRMQARYRQGTDKPNLLHTLNGSGLAVGRTLVAVLENYQQEDGSIIIPEVLRPYMQVDKIG